MPNTRLIKRRIRSAQNIAKITKAMEMVSASKMRRAQQQVLASRPYSEKLAQSLGTVARFTDLSLHPLLQEHPEGHPLLVVLSTDRGLCGGLNANLFKLVWQFTETHPGTKLVVVGRKAREFATRSGLPLVASFSDLPEHLRFHDVLPLSNLIIPGFLGDEFSSVTLAHMRFISTLSQEPTLTPLLPLDAVESPEIVPEEKIFSKEYIFEPDPQTILNALLPAYLETQLYQHLLDARASEHSARMISMQNASNNAQDVVAGLQLEYNKNRQSAITTELIEMNSATLALNG